MKAKQIIWKKETAKKSKYLNKKTKIDGITFDSIGEGNRYLFLRILERGGEIQNLKVHTRWPLLVGESKIGAYESDFDYIEPINGNWENGGHLVCEDFKGKQTPLSAWKFKHAKAQYHEAEWRIVWAKS